MKKQGLKVRAALFLVMAALASSPVLTSVAAATKKDVSSAKDKKSTLKQEKKKTEEAIKSLQGLKSNTESYVKELDTKMNDLQSQVTKLENNISSKQKSIDETAVKLEEAQKTEEKQYASMKMRIKYMYENGNTKFVDILCQSKDISEFLNNAEYISTISSYDREQLVAYQQIRKKVQEQQAALEEEYAKLEDLQNDLIAKQTNVESLKASKESEISSISGELEQTNQKLAELQAAAEEAARKQKEKEAAAAAAKKNNNSGSAGGAVVSGNGMFTHPCPGYSRISSTFGYRNAPLAGASTNHKGVDFAASTGTPIYAAAAGTVTSAGYSGKAGNLIIINHGNGLLTYYMHCNTIFVSAGQKVSKGQNIGQVGTTGNSTGPHLHFQVMNNGTPVNPMNYL